MIEIGILGASGRMGQTLVESVIADEGAVLRAATVRSGHGLEGTAVSSRDLQYSADLGEAFKCCDVMIDFTLPPATSLFMREAIAAKTPLIIGTTGLGAAEHALMEELARVVPVVYGTNMSLGVNLLNALVEKASKALGEDFDIEIQEMHHRHKKDLPSGTALTLGEYAARGRGVDLADVECVRHEQGERLPGQIGFSALRGGGIFGDHDVVMASDEEMVTLSHRALTRSVFAKGALRAAKWIVNQPPGLYSMGDVLGV